MRYQAAPLPEPQEPLAFRPQNATLNPPAARIHRTGRTVGGKQFGHARVINLTRVAAKCATIRGRTTMAELLAAIGFRRIGNTSLMSRSEEHTSELQSLMRIS